MITLALALVVQLSGSQDTSMTRVESLLATGDVGAALKLAGQLVERRPRDARAHLLLGKVHYARPTIGRYSALEAFRTAARLNGNDPEPWYWQMKVGFYLRSDDGEWIAREALLRLFALDPDYKDSWARFREVYQGAKVARRAERALARHGNDPIALEHRAELLIGLDEPARADSLLAVLTSQIPRSVTTCLMRAEANVLAGRMDAGFAWHDSALARAEEDSTGALWDEAWLIASPDEVARHAELLPAERRAFFARFWAQRDPNLLTRQNERLQEHYERRAEARRTYRLPHPQRTIYHSKLARVLAGFDIDRSLQDTALPQALRAGVTAPGMVFLRYGKPDQQANCVTDIARQGIYELGCTSHLTSESWLYQTPQGPLSIRFAGNEYFSPVSQRQLHDSYVVLNSDRTSVRAPLVARSWTAVFMSDEAGLTDVYYKARADSFAVALWDQSAAPLQAAGKELVRLRVAPGVYGLGLDVDSAGVLGRIRDSIVVPMFSSASLDLSSLVLAPTARDAPLPDRAAALRGMPADLAFRTSVPLAAYLEVYGLGVDGGSRARYQVRYTFAPRTSTFAKLLGAAARPVVFEFERVAGPGVAAERLVIDPDRLPAGRYRVTVAVTDLTRNVKSESVALDISIR